MDKDELEQQRTEMRLRSQELDRERKKLLWLAVHNNARKKAEKGGFQWKDVEFGADGWVYIIEEEGGSGDQAARSRHLENDEDEDDGDWEVEGEDQGGSSDEWTDLSSSASDSTSGSDEGEGRAVSEGPASPPLEAQTSDEWTDCSSSTGDEASGSDEPQD